MQKGCEAVGEEGETLQFCCIFLQFAHRVYKSKGNIYPLKSIFCFGIFQFQDLDFIALRFRIIYESAGCVILQCLGGKSKYEVPCRLAALQ